MHIDDLEDEELDALDVADEDELAAAAAEEEALLEGDDEPGEEFDEPRLSLRQKIAVTVTVFVSFLVFTILFFPLEDFVRYQLTTLSRSIQVEFTSLELNPFGSDHISGLRAQLPDGSVEVAAKDVESQLGWRQLLASRPQGLVRVLGADFSTQDLAFEAARLDLGLNINDASAPLRNWRGRVTINAQKLAFSKLPLESLPIPGIDPTEIQVQRLDLNMDFNNGQVSFQDSRLTSDLFTVRLNGTGQLQNTLGSTVLTSELCLDPVDDLQERNPQLFGLMLAMGGSAGGEVCADLNGPLGRPDFKLRRPQFGAPDNTGGNTGGETAASGDSQAKNLPDGETAEDTEP